MTNIAERNGNGAGREGLHTANPIPLPPPPVPLLIALDALAEISDAAQRAVAALRAPSPSPPDVPRPMAFVDVHAGAVDLRTSRTPIALRRRDDDVDPPEPGPRPRPDPVPAPAPQPAPVVGPSDVTVGVNGWGIVFTLSSGAAQSLANGATVVAAFVGAAAAAFPPAAFVAGIVSGFIEANALWISKIDQGRGVYLTLPWLLPGVVIPGAR